MKQFEIVCPKHLFSKIDFGTSMLSKSPTTESWLASLVPSQQNRQTFLSRSEESGPHLAITAQPNMKITSKMLCNVHWTFKPSLGTSEARESALPTCLLSSLKDHGIGCKAWMVTSHGSLTNSDMDGVRNMAELHHQPWSMNDESKQT